MLIDMICWIGIMIAALFGLGVIIALAMAVAMVREIRLYEKDEQKR